MNSRIKQNFLFNLDTLLIKATFWSPSRKSLAFNFCDFVLVFFVTAALCYAVNAASYLTFQLSSLGAIAFLCCANTIKLYSASVRYMGFAVVQRTTLSILGALLVVGVVSRSMSIDTSDAFYPLLFLCLMSVLCGYRLFLRELLAKLRLAPAIPCLVYGVNETSIQFLSSSLQGSNIKVLGFFDFTDQMMGRSYHGRKVISNSDAMLLIEKEMIDLVVVSPTSEPQSKRKQILSRLFDTRARVMALPALDELLSGDVATLKLRDFELEDLLGREAASPHDMELVKNELSGKKVIITGAGGSIGSELARQIARCELLELVVLDVSEPSLFKIEQELSPLLGNKLRPVLGSVCDSRFVDMVFDSMKPDIVFHAAAYKHVPMVEQNVLAAVEVNVLGTNNVIESALKWGAQSFTLVSTDKAVRPTNVMGRTKRVAELLCSAKQCATTKISMVRFGNVLGSSGSVIPTFERQIAEGGPVTVTHPEIVRYFMTIPEAAHLVLQASILARPNLAEVFLLDMGDAIKISDLAEKLIKLSGRRVLKESDSKVSGGISIQYTGLRPGEKMYEELLIDAIASPTEHQKIFRAQEPKLMAAQVDSMLRDLSDVLNEWDSMKAREILQQFMHISVEDNNESTKTAVDQQ